MTRKKKQIDPEDSANEGRNESNQVPGRTPSKGVPHVWDQPEDSHDPPSQRPEDTYEEARRRRRAV